MVRVLLVEDDPQIAKSLSMSLELDGFGVQRKETVASAWEELGRSAYDVLLLDVGLPDGSGIDLCQRLRAQGNTVPVLFLSARTDEETVVRGIEQGGDDYIRKPFGISELKARIQKVLRGNGANGNILRAGPLMVDVDKRVVTLQGRTLPLGKREFDILAVLAKKAGDVLSRDSILASFEERPDLFDRTIDSHMSHLRRKMHDVAGESVQITSVYGVGYRLDWTR